MLKSRCLAAAMVPGMVSLSSMCTAPGTIGMCERSHMTVLTRRSLVPTTTEHKTTVPGTTRYCTRYHLTYQSHSHMTLSFFNYFSILHHSKNDSSLSTFSIEVLLHLVSIQSNAVCLYSISIHIWCCLWIMSSLCIVNQHNISFVCSHSDFNKQHVETTCFYILL